LASRNAPTATSSILSQSASTLPLCCSNSGAGLTAGGAPPKRAGQPAHRGLPDFALLEGRIVGDLARIEHRSGQGGRADRGERQRQTPVMDRVLGLEKCPFTRPNGQGRL